jgi:hypothetical protein
MTGAKVFLTNGEPVARAYAIVRVPSPIAAPLVELSRVEILDPRRTATLRSDRPRGPGPRDPRQKAWQGQKRPGVELPDGRPIMKTQRIFVDPELIDQWDQEERNSKAAGTR